MTGYRDDWKPWLDELYQRRVEAHTMGGADRVQRLMHDRAKLSVRERIDLLFDPGSFCEVGEFVGTDDGIPADGFVAGHGLIDGRRCVVGAEDFSLLGGSIGPGGSAKRYRMAELAAQERVPLITMLDGAGHRLTNTGGSRSPGDLQAYADLGGQVPMVCLVMGASAGHGALAAPLSDYVIMTEQASMFTGGPPLVKAATGEDVTKTELGGPDVCARIAGTAHAVVTDDAQAIVQARAWLSFMPSSAGAPIPRREGLDSGSRRVDELLDIIPPNPRTPYDIHAVIEAIVDDKRVLEFQPDHGQSIICGLAHLGGAAVAIVANNPARYAGTVDRNAAVKATEFIEIIGAFGHPVIFLVDNPGVMAGTAAEQSGILKWAGRMYKAERRISNPKLVVTLRKAFGFGSVVMAQNPFDKQTVTLALPSVTTAAMPADSGGRSAGLDQTTQAAVEAGQRNGPWRQANKLSYDRVVHPADLRNEFLAGLDLAASRAPS